MPADPSAKPVPTAAGERIVAIDVLRGFALLGILLVNVGAFAMVGAAYLNPFADGRLQGAELWTWGAVHLFAEAKFLTLFSVLFGAGIAMASDRLAARGLPAARGVHYRRQLWLLAIGLAHAHLIWMGDILVAYALCGMLLHPLRNLRPRRLLALGACLIAVVLPMWGGFGATIPYWPEEDRAAQEQEWAPPRDAMDAEIEAYRGGWLEQQPLRSANALAMETVVFLTLFLWRAGGAMLVGMALYRWGVLSAERSSKFYKRMAVVGAGLGFPLIALGMAYNLRAGFAMEASMFQGQLFNYVGSLGVAAAYLGLVMLAVRGGWAAGLQRRLAAAGRMALTNYVAQSVACTLVFYGHGLGLFERLGRPEQLGVVAAVWVLQLLWSPWWLARFRFGPLEWAWRTATYMTRQPFRARAAGGRA